MAVTAIETHYGGCRFRSRLEARWAVFFDHFGVEWEYEPQSVVVSHRLSLEEGTFNYLPDFWLPRLGLWVEVTGSLDEVECLRLLDAAASLSSNNGGGCHDAGGHDMLVLGPVPRPTETVGVFTSYRVPALLHMHKGDLEAYAWPIHEPHGSRYDVLAQDVGGFDYVVRNPGHTFPQVIKVLLKGLPTMTPPPARFVRAITAARSAQFEHGEQG